ncbi:GTP-binding protein [Rhodopseudomonas sp. HC1]|uniref:CobW family GTP-binding protein n=1 Tax=Rhodopseudomonas infernalis TaxID=2897386 RepID=UPI001EE8C535|nr:GTP-binding protein [Rhodopseudomonas infernalis]MCG6204668.1 GTP-binding protein [Rhodopseudomonas infernalis]
MRKATATIPVTVIGGFLGAGKTTFVNHLLAGGGPRTAVLVNDFGEINVDAALIQGHDGTTMTLTNGCICCSIGTSFIETMCKVLDAEVPFERIVIEASGVGDPWKIAEIALIEPTLRLDRVIVLADASRIAALIDDARVGATVRSQFERCDVALLSKTDLVDAAALTAAHAAVRTLRPGLRIVETAPGTMPTLASLDAPAKASAFRADSPAASDHGASFRSFAYRRDGTFDRARIAGAVAALPPELLRLKGSCRLDGEDAAQVFQMVEGVWSLSPAAAPSATDRTEPAGIVLVGVGTAALPEPAVLDAILDRALAAGAAA